MTYLKDKKDRVHIDIYAVPNARKTQIVGEYDGRLRVKVQSPPVDGKANQEIIDFFSKLFAVPKKNVTVVRGETSQRKTIEIFGVTLDQSSKRLSS